jgi:hypothetical protein
MEVIEIELFSLLFFTFFTYFSCPWLPHIQTLHRAAGDGVDLLGSVESERSIDVIDNKTDHSSQLLVTRWAGDLQQAGTAPQRNREMPINTRTGEPTNKPRRLTNWAGFQLSNLTPTADGKRLAFLKQTSHSGVYVGELQANGTRLKGPPRRLTVGEYDDLPMAWTRDSKAVLFGSYRDGRREVLKQALDQDSAETLVTGENDTAPRLSADGSWVLYSVSPQNAGLTTPINLLRVPTSGGPAHLVLTSRGLTDWRCALSPATLCVLTERSSDQRQLTFIAFDPIQGRGRELMKIETDPTGIYSFDLSPDASRLAVEKTGEDHIRILPLDGGAPRDVNAKGWATLNSLDWATDGKGFFASSQSPQGVTLLHIDLEGNAQTLWTQKGSSQTWGYTFA